MPDLAAAVLDDEEAVEQLEGHRGHGEEGEGHDHFAVIPQKGQPAFARVTLATNSPKVAGHGPFRDPEAQFQEFSVDLGSTPAGIPFRHPADEPPDFSGDLGPTALRPGPPTLVEAETGAMPTDDGLWFHDDQDIGPAGPEPAKGRPEESGQVAQGRPRPSAFQYRDLLSKGKDFEGSVASTAEEDANGSQESKDELEHKPYREIPQLITALNAARSPARLSAVALARKVG